MSSSGSGGESKSGSGSGSGSGGSGGEREITEWERRDRRSVSRGNTIRRTARTQPPTLIRMPPTHESLRRALPKAIRTHGSFRQRLIEQTKQMGRENRDFRSSMGTRMSATSKSSETPREISSHIGDFAEPNYISDLTKTSIGFPSKRVARLSRDKDGNKVVKREKSPRKKGGRRTRRRRKSRRGRKSRRRKSRKSRRRKSRKSRHTRRKR